jgi:type I restriction enzyme S subunit
LKDLGQWAGGGTPSKSKPEYWTEGSIPWVSPKDMKWARIADSEDHITTAAVSHSPAKLIAPGSVLVVTRSGILSHTLPVAVTDVPVTVNQDLKALTPHQGVLPEYVAWALRCFSRDILKTCSKQGTTVASIETAALQRFEIPLAPLEDQRSIVAEIEKQFSRLDEAVGNLNRVKVSLKRYKAAVLKAAVEGRLVETEAEVARREGRTSESGDDRLRLVLDMQRRKSAGKYKPPASAQTHALPRLPEGWTWATPAQLAAGTPYSLSIGPFGSNLRVDDYTDTGVPLVFVANVRAASFGGANTICVSEAKANELRAHRVEGGDLLVTKMGDPPGDVAFYPRHRPPGVITADCIRLKLSDLVVPEFVAYAIQSEFVRRQILGITKGVAQLKVSLQRFKGIGLPLPPYQEQQRIVAEVDRRLAHVQPIAALESTTHERTNCLRRSILTRAFSGYGNGERAYEKS